VTSVAVKRAQVKQGVSVTLDPMSWRPVTRRPAPRKLILLEVMAGVWTFQDPGNTCLYRCEVDPDGSEGWFFKVLHREPAGSRSPMRRDSLGSSVKPSESLLFMGVSATMDCNGRPVVCRAEVLALKVDRRRARKL